MKKISSLLCLVLILGLAIDLRAQNNNVGIGTQTPDASAILQLSAPKQGFLVPTMDSVSRQGITNPADGLLVYDNSYDCFYYFAAVTSSWVSLCPTTGGTTTTTSYNTGVTYNTTNDSLSVTDGGGTLSAYINNYNIALSYDTATDSLRVTDGAGTISTYINPPGRWQARGTTDITYTTTFGAVLPTASTMAGTTVTFTPSKPVVYITATASGSTDAAATGAVLVRVRDNVANTVVIGASTSLTTTLAGSWNVAMTTSYNVTPGVPVTLSMEWAGVFSDLGAHAINCAAASDLSQASHRSIIVLE